MLFLKTLFTLTLALLTVSTNVNAVALQVDDPSPIIANNVKIGAFAPPSPYDGGLTAVNNLENSLGRKIDIVSWYKSWGEESGQFTYGYYGTEG